MADVFRPIPPPTEDEDGTPPPRRLFWFVAIAILSALATAAVAYALRAALL